MRVCKGAVASALEIDVFEVEGVEVPGYYAGSSISNYQLGEPGWRRTRAEEEREEARN